MVIVVVVGIVVVLGMVVVVVVMVMVVVANDGMVGVPAMVLGVVCGFCHYWLSGCGSLVLMFFLFGVVLFMIVDYVCDGDKATSTSATSVHLLTELQNLNFALLLGQVKAAEESPIFEMPGPRSMVDLQNPL